jgi:hypothetical protein
LKDSVGTHCLDEQGQPHKFFRVARRQGVCIYDTSYTGACLISLTAYDACPVITVRC